MPQSARMLSVETTSDRRLANDRRGAGRRIEELTAALAEDQVEVLFQPQYACDDGKLIGAEVLSRWNSPSLGQIGIEALFDIAKWARRSGELTRHIARRALGIAAGWPKSLRLSLNIAASDLADENFVDAMLRLADEADFDPARLTLEITEQALLLDLDRSCETLRRLAASGIRIALDDFGAGFCNFRYLKRLPLHVLKLDRSMVEGIVDDERDRAVLRAILTMARALGLRVVAEGIETEAQRATIAREGCEKWQGFLGGAPMTAEQFGLIAARPRLSRASPPF